MLAHQLRFYGLEDFRIVFCEDLPRFLQCVVPFGKLTGLQEPLFDFTDLIQTSLMTGAFELCIKPSVNQLGSSVVIHHPSANA